MQDRDFGRSSPGPRSLQRVLGAVLSLVPLWVCIGIAAFVLTQERLLGGIEAVLLVAMAALGLIELRRQSQGPAPQLAPIIPPRPARAAAAQRPARFQFKQTLMLAGLVGAYLHYYFWDVQVQIASLPHVTVFAATSLG